MRHPLDQVPQRSLVLRYKLLLDHTCDNLGCGHARCVDNRLTIGFLVITNPRSTFSTKVAHNLGKKRIARLHRMVTSRESVPASTRGDLPNRREELVVASSR